MDFDEAIQVHAAWKIKLSAYLRKADGSLNSGEVRSDNRCALGQWLYGEGRKHASTLEYQTLISEHAKFHRAAADVIDKANKGAANANAMLNFSSDYGIASRNVVTAIMQLKKKAAAR